MLTRPTPKPIVIDEQIAALLQKNIGANNTFEGYYKAVSKNAERFPTECLIELDKTFDPAVSMVRRTQEGYKDGPPTYIKYCLMSKAYLPILELYARCEVLETPHEQFWFRFRAADDRRKFINSNKLRTARFYKYLNERKMTEEQYYREFAIRTQLKHHSIAGQVVRTHPIAKPEENARQWASDVDYPNRVAKEVIYHDNVYAEIY